VSAGSRTQIQTNRKTHPDPNKPKNAPRSNQTEKLCYLGGRWRWPNIILTVLRLFLFERRTFQRTRTIPQSIIKRRRLSSELNRIIVLPKCFLRFCYPFEYTNIYFLRPQYDISTLSTHQNTCRYINIDKVETSFYGRMEYYITLYEHMGSLSSFIRA
jgi:hypothetical protein